MVRAQGRAALYRRSQGRLSQAPPVQGPAVVDHVADLVKPRQLALVDAHFKHEPLYAEFRGLFAGLVEDNEASPRRKIRPQPFARQAPLDPQ